MQQKVLTLCIPKQGKTNALLLMVLDDFCVHMGVDKKTGVSINADKLPEAKAVCYITIIDETVDGKKMEETKIDLLGVWLLTGPKMRIPALHGINTPEQSWRKCCGAFCKLLWRKIINPMTNWGELLFHGLKKKKIAQEGQRYEIGWIERRVQQPEARALRWMLHAHSLWSDMGIDLNWKKSQQ